MTVLFALGFHCPAFSSLIRLIYRVKSGSRRKFVQNKQQSTFGMSKRESLEDTRGTRSRWYSVFNLISQNRSYIIAKLAVPAKPQNSLYTQMSLSASRNARHWDGKKTVICPNDQAKNLLTGIELYCHHIRENRSFLDSQLAVILAFIACNSKMRYCDSTQNELSSFL